MVVRESSRALVAPTFRSGPIDVRAFVSNVRGEMRRQPVLLGDEPTENRRSPDDLTVVVVNWGTPDLTIRCVTALQEDGVPAHRIVVVDNGSSDDSVARFEEQLGDCVLHRIASNVGYARAANAGARRCPGRDYLFVNNDAFVHRRGSVAALLRCLADDTIGIVTARTLNEDLTLQVSVYPIQTPAVALVLASGLSRLLPNRWQPAWGWAWDHGESREIAGTSGVAMLVRGTLWEDLHGFVESVPLYSEDMDICWRARESGWKVWFTIDSEFVHLGRATTNNQFDSVRRAELIANADAGMTRRNLPAFSASLTLAIKSAGLRGRWAYHTVTRNRDAAELAGAELRGTRQRDGRSQEPNDAVASGLDLDSVPHTDVTGRRSS